MAQPDNYSSPLVQALQSQQPDLGGALLGGYQQGLMRPLQQAQMQAQISQQQQLLQARQDFISNPTPQSVRALAALDPQNFAAINTAHSLQTQDAQNQNVRDLSSFAALAQAGRYDDAKALAQQRVDADNAAGQDSSAAQALLNTLNADPTKAAGVAHYMLAGMVGPDKWAEANKDLADSDRANAKLPGEIASTTANTAKTVAETNQITNPRPETAATTGADGNPIFYNKNAAPPVTAGASADSPALSALIPKLIGSESGGDPNAKNPNSTATGAGQFLNKTWVPLFKQIHPDLAEGKTDAQILAYRSNPQYAAEGVAAYARQNADTLSASGLPVNGATLAMAHKLGPGGAQAVLGADPNAALSSVLPAEVIKANPQLAKLTAGQYATTLSKQFGTDPINAAPDPSATGDQFLATLPPGRAKLIKAIANGDAPMPTGRSATTGAGQALMQQVLQYDPTASAINLHTRQATRLAFTKGPEGQAINSANTVVGHLVGLDHAIDGLHNTGLSWINGPAQFIGRNVGNGDTQKAVANFNFYKTAVANELTKVFRGSNGAEADVQGWLKQLDSAKSPVELHQTVSSMIDGMKSRLEALGNQYNTGMQTNLGPLELLSPHSRALLSQLDGSGGASSAAPKVAVNPKTGEKVVYDAASRTWKPA